MLSTQSQPLLSSRARSASHRSNFSESFSVTAMKNAAAGLPASVMCVYFTFLIISILTSSVQRSLGLLTKPRISYGGWTPILPGHPFYFGPSSQKRNPQHLFDDGSGYKFVEPHYRHIKTTIIPHPHAAYSVAGRNAIGTKSTKDIYAFYPPSSPEPLTQQIEYKPLYIELPRKPLEIFEKPKEDVSSFAQVAALNHQNPTGFHHGLQEQTYLKITPLGHSEEQHIGYPGGRLSNTPLTHHPSIGGGFDSLPVHEHGLAEFQEPQQKIIIQPTLEFENQQQKENQHPNSDNSEFLMIPPGEILSKFQSNANRNPEVNSVYEQNHGFASYNLQGTPRGHSFTPHAVAGPKQGTPLDLLQGLIQKFTTSLLEKDPENVVPNTAFFPSQEKTPMGFLHESALGNLSYLQPPERKNLMKQLFQAKQHFKSLPVDYAEFNGQYVPVQNARSPQVSTIPDNRKGLYPEYPAKYSSNIFHPHSFENGNIQSNIILNHQPSPKQIAPDPSIHYVHHDIRNLPNRNQFRGPIPNTKDFNHQRNVHQMITQVQTTKERVPLVTLHQGFIPSLSHNTHGSYQQQNAGKSNIILHTSRDHEVAALSNKDKIASINPILDLVLGKNGPNNGMEIISDMGNADLNHHGSTLQVKSYQNSQLGRHFPFGDQFRDSFVTESVQRSQHVNATTLEAPAAHRHHSSRQNLINDKDQGVKFIEIPVTASYVSQNEAFPFDHQKEPIFDVASTPYSKSLRDIEEAVEKSFNISYSVPDDNKIWYSNSPRPNMGKGSKTENANPKSSTPVIQSPPSYTESKHHTESVSQKPLPSIPVNESGRSLGTGDPNPGIYRGNKQNSTKVHETGGPQLFHAYYAASNHSAPEGYVKMTVKEFNNLFRSAEIRYVDDEAPKADGTPVGGNAK